MTRPVQINNLVLGAGMPKICVPLTGICESELCSQAKKIAEAKPDLVEWRADFYEYLSDIQKVETMLKKLKEILAGIPVLFTIRTVWEGGQAELDPEVYRSINRSVAAANLAELIDVEVFGGNMYEDICPDIIGFIEDLHETNVKVIASSHDFEKTDSAEVLLRRFRSMDTSGADILKMAVMPRCEADVQAIMEATDQMRLHDTERPLISMSMGALGTVSRIEGERFGSTLTFATVGAASAPGQIPLEELREKILQLHKEICSKKDEKFC